MSILAEAVLTEIQDRRRDLVEESNFARVRMVSPTTLRAVLNPSSRTAFKDAATRQQILPTDGWFGKAHGASAYISAKNYFTV